MRFFRKYFNEFILILLLIIFTAFKIQDATLPYFWDEMGVFVRTIFYMLENKISLLPGDIPPELSRGHPLLFTFLHSLAYSVFGNSPWVGRIFELLMSLLILFLTYRLGTLICNKLTGLFAAILLAAQPLFYAQAGLILPETMLTLAVLLTALAYLKKKWAYYFLAASFALWIKESAVILPIAIFFTEILYQLLQGNKKGSTFYIRSFLLCFSPYCAFAVFLILQKLQNGWFFFPYHMEHVNLDLLNTFRQLIRFLEFVFYSQGRWIWSFILLLTAVKYLLRNKLDGQRIPRAGLLFFFIIAGLLGFSTINFYMNRYLLFSFPFLAILVARSLIYWHESRPFFQSSLVMLMVLLHSIYMRTPHFNYDEDMSYINSIEVIQKADAYLKAKGLADAVLVANHPVSFALKDPRMGYTDKAYNIHWQITPETEYCLNYSPGSFDVGKPEAYEFDSLTIIQSGYAKILLYKVSEL